MPPLTYLTVDSVVTGVGTSQVLPYVTRLAARGLPVALHSFEPARPSGELVDDLRRAGVDWHPHRFRGGGSRGGVGRVLAGAVAARGRPLVHCRSTLPAASALLGRPGAWVWDRRDFWLDERIALGSVVPGSAQDHVVRRVEHAAAERADAVITLTAAAVGELERRHPGFERQRATVVPTCVDLDRFAPAPFVPPDPIVVMFSGSFNERYDAPVASRLINHLRARAAGPVAVRVLRPHGSPDTPGVRALAAAGASVGAARFEDMPDELRAAHVGFAILRRDLPTVTAGGAPTKIAEFLACGRPVVVSAGLGDYGELLPAHRAGVVVGGDTEADLDRAAGEVLALLADPATPERCRGLAERRFGLDHAVDLLMDVYRRASGEA